MQTSYRVLGLMSGTSVDGLDLACADFLLKDGKWTFELLAAESIDYEGRLREQLKASINLPAEELLVFHNEYGQYLGESSAYFLNKHGLSVQFIASHGHTVFHQPERQLTFQLGYGQALADSSGFEVVCDFRSTDILLGGEGAPLVPVGDQMLFSDYDVCINLGGISNCSFDQGGRRIAFDVCATNMLLNALVNEIGLAFDENGQLAAKGELDTRLFQALNEIPYFLKEPPKSLGFEWFQDAVEPILGKHSALNLASRLNTAVHHIAFQIKQALDKIPDHSRILLTGGGARNKFLVSTIQEYFPNHEVIVPAVEIADFKEAIVFGFLGILRARKEVNILSSVTGALHDSYGGVWYYPQKVKS